MWCNLIVKWIYSSPLSGLMSKNTMLVSFIGRNSGREYTLPVNYIQHDNILLATSYHHRTWWRNLCEGVPITLRVRGQTLRGIGEAITSEAS